MLLVEIYAMSLCMKMVLDYSCNAEDSIKIGDFKKEGSDRLLLATRSCMTRRVVS